MHTAEHIADLILSRDTEQEFMSNLKLQKMLYYEQGFHLAVFGKPLFGEDIEAWNYGPVVPGVYEKFAGNGKRGIVPPENVDFDLDKESGELFDEVFGIYNQFSAAKLVEMTHGETPWRTTEVGRGNVIGKDKLRDFFLTRLADG